MRIQRSEGLGSRLLCDCFILKVKGCGHASSVYVCALCTTCFTEAHKYHTLYYMYNTTEHAQQSTGHKSEGALSLAMNR